MNRPSAVVLLEGIDLLPWLQHLRDIKPNFPNVFESENLPLAG